MAFSINSTRSKIVGIFIVILLVILLTVGVFWLVSLSPDEEPITLEYVPKFGEGSMIRYNMSDKNSVEKAIRKIDQLLEPYSYQNDKIYKGCDFNRPPPDGKTCNVDLKYFGPCTKGNSYGYKSGTPCVFLKLTSNRTWIPEFYNETTLPESMPTDLKNDIIATINKNPRNSKIVWVSCEGRDSVSADDIGPLDYYRYRGFAGYYFPCKSDESCTSPLVAVHFKRPRYRTIISVQCKLWAPNLQETVDFALYID